MVGPPQISDRAWNTVLAILAAIGFIIGGWVYTDSRWNQQADVKQLTQAVNTLQKTVNSSIGQLRDILTDNTTQNRCLMLYNQRRIATIEWERESAQKDANQHLLAELRREISIVDLQLKKKCLE